MIIVYGDVELIYEQTQVNEYRSIYTPDGADFLYYHYRLGANCEVSPETTGQFASVGEGVEILSRIMMEPGQRLTVMDDAGNIIVDSPV